MRRLAIAALFLLLLAAPASAERIRVHMVITDGQLIAASNAIKDSILDPRSGGLDTFSVDIQLIGGGGVGWNGASWVMEREGVATISWEVFLADIIGTLNMKHNTGLANVQIVTAIHDDETPELSPLAGFLVLLADVTKKPNALEIVPVDPFP